MTTMTTAAADSGRQEAAQAGRREAEGDFARAASDDYLIRARKGHWERVTGLHLPADGALRNAWLAAYAARFAELAAPCMTETRLIAAGREPRFHAGQRIEFASLDCIVLGRGEWQAGEIAGYFEPEWQPLPSVSHNLQLTVRAIGKRGNPVRKRIEVSEYQVRLPQDAGVTS
jgi:hypothetical protein